MWTSKNQGNTVHLSDMLRMDLEFMGSEITGECLSWMSVMVILVSFRIRIILAYVFRQNYIFMYHYLEYFLLIKATNNDIEFDEKSFIFFRELNITTM